MRGVRSFSGMDGKSGLFELMGLIIRTKIMILPANYEKLQFLGISYRFVVAVLINYLN
jgi:hypothetical protein